MLVCLMDYEYLTNVMLVGRGGCDLRMAEGRWSSEMYTESVVDRSTSLTEAEVHSLQFPSANCII